jgi:hypothetical protein
VNEIPKKQTKIEITLYTNLEPVYGMSGGKLPPDRILRQNEGRDINSDRLLTKSYPPRFRALLEQLIMTMKADKFSFRHYYEDGTVRDFEPWE